MADSSIEWTDSVWNPVRGCSLTSPGCARCYAMKQAHRFSGQGKPYEGLTHLSSRGPVWTGVVRTVPDALDVPLRWKKPRKIFVNSMSDLFHEDVPNEFIADVFGIMAACQQHTFQVLTKRSERMLEWFELANRHARAIYAPRDSSGRMIRDLKDKIALGTWPLPNVWIGVSVEDQQRADERIPHLLRTPAAVRFLSCEPLLGPVNLREIAPQDDFYVDSLDTPDPTAKIDWVIVGGESGHGAREMRLDWAQRIVDDCKKACVPVFVKQLGAKPVEFLDPWSLNDSKGGDMAEWPESLRVREFPRCR